MAYIRKRTISEVFSNLARFGFAADWEGSGFKEKCNFVGEVTGHSKADWTMRALIKLTDLYISDNLPYGKWFQLPSITMAELIPRSVEEPDVRKAREELHRLTQKAAVRVLNEIRKFRDHPFVKTGLVKIDLNYESPPSTKVELTIEGVSVILRLPEFKDFYIDYQDELKKRALDYNTRYRSIADLAKPKVGRVILPMRKLDSVSLSNENKQSVNIFVKSVENIATLEKWGIKYNPKILLSGKIGTGKSILAEAIAAKCNKGLYIVGSDNLIDSYLGESAKRVNHMLSHAATYSDDLILFIDEIDGLLGSRGKAESGASREVSRAVNTFLALIEMNHNVVMIGATNHPHLLDPAAFSRFTQRIWLDLPDKDMIKDMLKQHLSKIPLGEHINLDNIVAKLAHENITGRDIRNMVVTIVQIMMEEGASVCDQVIFENAIEQLLESLDIQKYGKMYGAELYANGFDTGIKPQSHSSFGQIPEQRDDKKTERRINNMHKDLSDEVNRIWEFLKRKFEDDPSKDDDDPWR